MQGNNSGLLLNNMSNPSNKLDPEERKLRRHESSKRYRAKDPEKCRQFCRDWQIANAEYRATTDRAKNRELRLFVLSHYSPPTPRCRCCGEFHIEFLHLHHKEGKGSQHRKEVGAGANFYKWIIRNDFPLGYEVLCANCDESEGHYGYCPHKAV